MTPKDFICRNISILFRYNQLEMVRRLEPLGIGLGQYPHIFAVCENPGISQDQLTSRLYYNKSSVARAIAALEANGFLRREVDPSDKRSYNIFPTPRALEALPVIRRQLRELVEDLTEDLTPSEAEAAGVLLEQMARRVTSGKVEALPRHAPAAAE